MADGDDKTNQATQAQLAADDLAKLTAKPVAEASLATEVEEFEEKQKDWQAMYNAGGPFKERVEAVAGEWRIKRKPPEAVVEIPSEPEVDKKLEGYIERVEKEVELTTPVMDDYTQQVLLKSAATKTEIKIPLTNEEIQKGLHQKVWDGLKWLAVWCLRQMKILGGKVIS